MLIEGISLLDVAEVDPRLHDAVTAAALEAGIISAPRLLLCHIPGGSVPSGADAPLNNAIARRRDNQSEVEAQEEAPGSNAVAPHERAFSYHHTLAGNVVRKLTPAMLGGALFLLNNLGVIHAFAAAPAGYSPFVVQRHGDVAQYLTWLAGLRTAWILPNYHAPWATPPGLFVAGLFPAALLERWFSLDPAVALQLLSLGGYVATAYALAFAYRTFFQTRGQAFRAFLISLTCVPLASLPGIFRIFQHVEGARSVLGWSAGANEFMMTSDGFLHGLVAWPLITFGACGEVLAVALLARYCRSHEMRWFRWLVAVCFIAGLMHPFEIFVIVFVATIVLLREAEPIARRLVRIGFILAAAGAGLAPYVIQSLRVPWVGEMTNVNRSGLYITPAYLVAGFGLPAIVLVVLLLLGLPKRQNGDGLILKTWLVSSFLLFYLPGMPFPLHFFDGVFFVIGMLLAMQVEDLEERQPIFARPLVRLLVATAMIWMLVPHLTFRVRSWKDGIALGNIRFASAIAPNDEMAALAWFRKNASPNDLILANGETASWLAAAPVHSFASHWLFSSAAARPNDAELKESFFEGKLPAERAHELLETLGVRFVVVPDDSCARSYLVNAVMRIHFNSSSIYELAGAQMKQYEDGAIVRLGR